MGKKKGRRKKQQYTVHDFVGICCDKCMLCAADTDPSFCFKHVYKQNPKRFINEVFPKLLDASSDILIGDDRGVSKEETATKIFDDAFGKVYFDNRKSARTAFVNQMLSYNKQDRPLTKKEKKKLKRERKRVVFEPYPTFFCNKGFEEEINRILHGDDNQQQDKVEEPTTGAERPVGGASDDTES